jgi:hypothetical protein
VIVAVAAVAPCTEATHAASGDDKQNPRHVHASRYPPLEGPGRIGVFCPAASHQVPSRRIST